MKRNLLLLASFMTFTSGCFVLDTSQTVFPCSVDADCPREQRCIMSACRLYEGDKDMASVQDSTVSLDQTDTTSDLEMSDQISTDIGGEDTSREDMQCVEDTDVFCQKHGAVCGMLTADGACGEAITRDCGTCMNATCMENQCVDCSPPVACTANSCGVRANACGQSDCGMCEGTQICKDFTCEDISFKAPPGGRAFGHAVAWFDENTLLVGAPDTQGRTANKRGAVYVYQREEDNTFKRVSELAPPNDVTQEFGFSIDTDGEKIIVGAPGLDRGSNKKGQAYIYHRDDSSNMFVLEETLTGNGKPFGFDVAIDGEFAAVGAHGTRSESGIFSNASGAVFLFRLDGGTWKSDHTSEGNDMLQPAENKRGDNVRFGHSVDLLVRSNADPLLIVGAPSEPSASVKDYVYRYKKAGNNRNWTNQNNSPHDGGKARDDVGYHVAFLENQDFITTAPKLNGGTGPDTGALILYHDVSTNWKSDRLYAPDLFRPNGSAGLSLAVFGNHVVVGDATGRVHVLTVKNRQFSPIQTIEGKDTHAFGHGLALILPQNGPGLLAVGAPLDGDGTIHIYAIRDN